MRVSISSALVLTAIMGGVIFFCRVFPFIFFREPPDPPGGLREKGRALRGSFLELVEKLVPPVAMTVLACNAISAPFTEGLRPGIPALIAAGVTAMVHLWKRNSLLSICGGTAVYMLLGTVLPRLLA
ncbi:MAG: AzlD domain-containing protein [Treponema sp.]|jgi:branched-subunit amino acid transport protein AzlD|nr:AzlD domain-containing protein [Treponema sp.]